MMFRKGLLILLIIGAVGIVYAYVNVSPMLPVATGYAAKKMCSCHFIAGRESIDIQETDLGFSPINLTSTVIDEHIKSATSSIFGLASKTAVYKENIGCILLQGDDDYNVHLSLPRYELAEHILWPHGQAKVETPLDGVNYAQLNKALDFAFEPSALTRAIVVIHRDTLIAERYAEGFDEDTEILGWSMTKSVTSTLFGILAKDKRVSLNEKPDFPEWRADERSKIRLRHLLNMQSGLAFSEIYDDLSDATRMLYMAEDVSAIPRSKSPIAPPDSIWNYSSGTSNLLQKILRNKFNSQDEYLKFPHDKLFRRIGMSSAHMETDESGLYIGSSYLYATPRDWAKFGLLYLNEGNWFGDQIIDTSWVDFSKSIASKSGGLYGGHFWQNGGQAAYPDLPEDMFSANGFQGQRVWIFPSQDLVVVRMGLGDESVFDMEGFLKELLLAFDLSIQS